MHTIMLKKKETDLFQPLQCVIRKTFAKLANNAKCLVFCPSHCKYVGNSNLSLSELIKFAQAHANLIHSGWVDHVSVRRYIGNKQSI